MKVTIAPVNAGYINRILFFNLSSKPFDRDDLFKDKNIHLAFVLDDAIIGVDMENYLFYCYLTKTLDWYGPYSTYQELITNLLFGDYDGLFALLNSIKFNKEKGLYVFTFEDFVWDITTNQFTTSIKKTAQTIKDSIRKINKPFFINKEPETSFGKGVIDEFLLSLDSNVFSKNSFPEKYISNNLCTLISIDREKAFGDKTPIKFYIVLNTSKKRHLVSFMPYWLYEDYVSFENKSSDNDLINELFDKNTVQTVSNIEDLLLAKRMFGIDISDELKEINLYKCNIFKYIQLVVPYTELGQVSYILHKDDKWYNLVFDAVRKHYILNDFNKFVSNNIPVDVVNGRLVVGSPCGDGDGFDLIINAGNCIFVDTYKGIAEFNKIIFDVRFFSNVEGVIK